MGNITFDLKKIIPAVVIGIIGIGLGLYIILSSGVNTSWTRTVGTVSGSSISDGFISKSYNPILDYDAKGTRYQVSSDLGTSTQPKPGEQRSVAYDPSNPSNARDVSAPNRHYFSWFLIIAGLFVIVFALYKFVSFPKHVPVKNKLKISGHKLSGFVMSIQNEIQDGKRGYRVMAVAADQNGIAKRFTSEFVAGASRIATIDFRKHRLPVDVYIDLSDTTKYLVDVSKILSLTKELVERQPATRK